MGFPLSDQLRKDEALLGAVTLETLGLMLNPLSRTLQPMRMVLARARRRVESHFQTMKPWAVPVPASLR